MDKFLVSGSVGQLGIAERRDVQSQDVSKNSSISGPAEKQASIGIRLMELVAKRGDEIKDILALETELSRVREEIERMEGRFDFSDRVTLTTVEIMASRELDISRRKRPLPAVRSTLLSLITCAIRGKVC